MADNKQFRDDGRIMNIFRRYFLLALFWLKKANENYACSFIWTYGMLFAILLLVQKYLRNCQGYPK